MANEDVYDSYEQSERARQWFQRNGGSLLIGVLGALAVIWGYNAWRGAKGAELERAAYAYSEVTTAIEAKNAENVTTAAGSLRKNFDGTTYAALGSLAEAGFLVSSNKLDAAEAALRYAAENGESTELKALASLRLARLLLAKDKPQDVLDMLGKLSADGFKANTEELRGDAYAQLGKSKEARAAYAAALTATDLATPGRSTLQMKLDNLVESKS